MAKYVNLLIKAIKHGISDVSNEHASLKLMGQFHDV